MTAIESTPPVDVATVGVCDCSQLPALTLAVILDPDDSIALNIHFTIVTQTPKRLHRNQKSASLKGVID